MTTRANTDNFLPTSRGKSAYQPRPILNVPRQATPRRASSISLSSVTKASPSKLPITRPTKTQNYLLYGLSLAVLLAVAGGLVSLRLFRSEVDLAPTLQAAAESTYVHGSQTPSKIGSPVRLKIPALGVDAAIEHVGLTSSGDLDVPKIHANAAWYNQGPRPGEIGNAVIDGHFGGEDDAPAVFDNLHLLQKGDLLQVEDDNGLVTTFKVRELRVYGPDEVAPEVFKSSDGRAHLNLITCEGAWNKTLKTYSNRLVVFTDKAVL